MLREDTGGCLRRSGDGIEWDGIEDGGGGVGMGWRIGRGEGMEDAVGGCWGEGFGEEWGWSGRGVGWNGGCWGRMLGVKGWKGGEGGEGMGWDGGGGRMLGVKGWKGGEGMGWDGMGWGMGGEGMRWRMLGAEWRGLGRGGEGLVMGLVMGFLISGIEIFRSVTVESRIPDMLGID